MTTTEHPTSLAHRLTPGTVVVLVENPFRPDREGTRTTILGRPDPTTGRVLVQENNRPPYRWQLPPAPSVHWDGDDLFSYPLPVDNRTEYPRTVTYRIEQ